MTDVTDFFEHHGIKGMKWGVRHTPAQLARMNGTDTRSEDFKKAQESLGKVKGGGTHTLTNEELQQLNKRLQLERSFKQMGPKGTFAKGAAFVVATLTVARTASEIHNFTRSPLATQIANSLKKKKG